jgi:FtsH-binding integral membrane protein
MFAQAAHQRPIPGAVATLGTNERVAFIKRTYAHLGAAILAFVAVVYGFLHTALAFDFTRWALSGSGNWMLVLVAFMLIGVATDRMSRSPTSVRVQYAGLVLGVIAEAIIITPLLFVATIYSKDPYIIHKAGVLTLAIFGGLTGAVFFTKKDFSFMRGALSILTFAALGVIVASWLFGFQLGTVFAVAMIGLMAGYVLYQTSAVMAHYPPTFHVAAALQLFSTIATMFWYVLQLLMSRRS